MPETPKSSFIYVPTRDNPPIEEEIPLPPGVKEPEIIDVPNALNSPTTQLHQYTFDEMISNVDKKD
jgi:hypothetical protein